MGEKIESTYVKDCKLIQLPKILDDRGNLTFLEENNHIPFNVKRVYWIYDVPGGEIRGGHAFKKQKEMIIALSGSFDIILSDGKDEIKVTLNRSYSGIFIPQMIWRHIENFSTNSACLCISSTEYDESDYIRDIEDFVNAKENVNSI